MKISREWSPSSPNHKYEALASELCGDMPSVKTFEDDTFSQKAIQRPLMTSNSVVYNTRRSKDGVQHEGKKDLLQVLLELNDQKNETSPSMTQIKALIMDIFLAGIDSSTTLLEWAMTEILKNRHVMNKIQKELANIVGVNSMVEESHLPKLQYLNATMFVT
ncbi:cytochrome P450 [Tanacetum coccineum]|uniref:Cytochrome P450 n=1 Tax=Tanacetum coccineum TaxID=301880 RepID=A0ABQ5GRR8_9ASTR